MLGAHEKKGRLSGGPGIAEQLPRRSYFTVTVSVAAMSLP